MNIPDPRSSENYRIIASARPTSTACLLQNNSREPSLRTNCTRIRFQGSNNTLCLRLSALGTPFIYSNTPSMPLVNIVHAHSNCDPMIVQKILIAHRMSPSEWCVYKPDYNACPCVLSHRTSIDRHLIPPPTQAVASDAQTYIFLSTSKDIRRHSTKSWSHSPLSSRYLEAT